MTDQPEIASFAEFARIAGYRRSYVTALKSAGRLVLTEDGQVRVAESLARIEATRDPSKAGVAARHAAHRAASAAAGGGEVDAPGAEGDEAEGSVPAAASTSGDSYAERRSKAMAVKEEAAARKALRDEAIELGQLMVGDQVVSTVAAGVTALRVRLESMAHDLAPQLAAQHDEVQVLQTLRDEIEAALAELSRELSRLGKAA